MAKKQFNERKLVSFLLRLGLALAFLYAGIGALINPLSWIGFIPSWVTNILPASLFLSIHAFVDITIGLWLLSGKKQFYAALFAGLSLLAIIILDIKLLDVIFRDISMLLSAIALMVIHAKEV